LRMNIRNRSVTVRSLDAGVSAQKRTGNGITVKSQQELDHMVEAGRITGLTLLKLRDAIVAGMTTAEVDAIAEREIIALGGIPAFKGLYGFPATLCISLNEQIVHGIPSGRVIREGDIIGLDLGAIIGGMYGDSALTISVGAPRDDVRAQLETGRAALFAGIAQVRAGNRVGDVSAAVQAEVERRGAYGIVREYVGHGIGRKLHEEPQVPNFGEVGRGPLLRPGMAIAIEPMVNLGTQATRVLDDDWTVVTADGMPSVHFEHTVIVTEGDPIVTTRVE
jgi:methionyl aminopeptidase